MSQDPGNPPQVDITQQPRKWIRWLHLFYEFYKSAFSFDGNLTVNGTFVVFGADDTTRFSLVRSSGAEGSLLFGGGGGQTTGGYFEAWGDQHATRADDFEAGAAGTAVFDWDESAGEFTIFTGSGGAKTQALTINSTQAVTAEGGLIDIDSVNATDSPQLRLLQAGTIRGYLQYQDSGDILRLDSDGAIILATNNTTALTINTSQQATFGGTATIPSTDALQFGGSNVRITGNSTTNIMSFYANGSEQMRVIDARVSFRGFANLGPLDELTIASGAITADHSFHRIDTESDAATDDLDTINGGSVGDILILQAMDSTRTVVVKNGTGNIDLAGSDFSLDNTLDKIMLVHNGNGWQEVSRSDNGA